MTLVLKAPAFQRLKLKYDILLSNFALNFNLRRYNKKRSTSISGIMKEQLSRSIFIEKHILASTAAEKDGTFYAYVAVQRPPTVAGQAPNLSNFAARLEDMRMKLAGDEREWRLRGCCPVSLNDGAFWRLKTELRHGGVHSLVWCAPGFGWVASSDNLDLDALCELLREPTVSAPSVVLLCFKRGGRRAAARLAAAGVRTVVSISADVMEEQGLNAFLAALQRALYAADVDTADVKRTAADVEASIMEGGCGATTKPYCCIKDELRTPWIPPKVGQ